MDIAASNQRFPPIRFDTEAVEGVVRRKPLGIERFFAMYFSHDLKDKSTGREVRGARMHADIAYVISNPRSYPYAIIVAPRGSAKSTYTTKIGPLYHAIVTKQFQEILLIGATEELAEGRLADIKSELVNNEILINGNSDENIPGFGDLSTQSWPDKKWAAGQIELPDGIKIWARGRGGSMRGIHPQYIIIDDIEGDEGVLSPTECAKIERWIKQTVIPMQIDEVACLHWDGTFLGPDSVLYNAYNGKGWSQNWFRMKYGAFDSKGHSYWPDRFSDEWLVKKREDMGAMAFAAEYLNEPFSVETPIIRRDWLKFFTEAEMPPMLSRVMSIDPAISIKQKSDFTAFGIIGADNNPDLPRERYFCEHFEEAHYSFDETIRRFFDLYLKYHPEKVRIEVNAYQDALRQAIDKERRLRGIEYIPIETEASSRYTGDLYQRLATVSPLVERGQVYFRREQEDLIYQLVNFPTRKDDLAQAFYSCLKGFQYNWTKVNESYMAKVVRGEFQDAGPAIPALGC